MVLFSCTVKIQLFYTSKVTRTIDELFYFLLSRSSKLRYAYKLWLAIKAAACFLVLKKAPMPGFAAIDPGNVCNLNCLVCVTGAALSDYPKGQLTLDGFKTLFAKVGKIRILALTFRGEPFLNQDIFDIISYAHNNLVVVEMFSNFSFEKDDAFFDKIITSGLDVLSLSFEGVSREVYETYRKGGNAALVRSNLLRLLDAKKRHRSRKPFIVWHHLYHKFNLHEISAARAEAKALKLRFRLMPVIGFSVLADIDPEKDLSEKQMTSYWHDLTDTRKRKLRSMIPYRWRWIRGLGFCKAILFFPIINWDGGVFPCCLMSKKDSVFGNLYKEEFSDIWNGSKYQSARNWQIYQNKELVHTASACLNCSVYLQPPFGASGNRIRI
jgi:radical SAM protein with 4Fe4S-binding SPASM domain